jgi:hypothetical protein
MSTRRSLPGLVRAARLRKAPEIKQAVAKADENAAKARSAKTAQDREYYERMSQKWLGIMPEAGLGVGKP